MSPYKNKADLTFVMISLTEHEINQIKIEMEKNAFKHQATFIKWVVLRYLREIQAAALSSLILCLFATQAAAGMDFRYMAGYGPALRQQTQIMVEAVQARSREQAQIAYERIQEILRDMPDSSKNAELLAMYRDILERMRDLANQSKAVLAQEQEEENGIYQQFKKLVSEQGSYLICSSQITRRDNK